MISVVIPVKDGGVDLVRCLEAIAHQQVDEQVEVVVVDSGSSDGSVERARRLGARIEEIPAASFSHGGARNRGVSLARGDIIVFTTQDAYPADERWLANLIGPIRRDQGVAGVYGRQLPHEDAIPSERYFLDFLYGENERTQRLTEGELLTFEATLFSNVNSAVPRAVLESFPFADDVVMSEDQEWSRRVLLSGMSIVYVPHAAVRHSHAYSISAAFSRFFDSGASADRAYVSRNRASRAALRRAGIRYARGELTWLWRSGQRRWIPYTVVYESAKFAGLQLGLRHEQIPRAVKRSLSGIPAHWERREQGVQQSLEPSDDALRVCLVYDHLFPQTVGGAERLMRDLALHLAGEGYRVTYLTMRHWKATETPQLEGVRVVAPTEAGLIYGRERRTLVPPVRFGLTVARYLWRHGSEFDIVHMASFPYFPVLAAGALRRRSGYELIVTWLEIWTKAYWRRYAGLVVGTIGWVVQRSCVRLHHTAFSISRLHARRLVDAGFDGTPLVFPGLYAGPIEPTPANNVDSKLVVYAGRHVAEKRVGALVQAFALARKEVPGLRLELYGDGPERPRLERLVGDLGLGAAVRLHGRRPESEIAETIAHAACVATASEREGYGLIIVEAAARGTPSVVVAGPENAATELVADGVNGAIASDASPAHLSAAIVRVVAAGPALRDTTTGWFAENAQTLRMERSLELVVRSYEQARARRYASRALSSREGG